MATHAMKNFVLDLLLRFKIIRQGECLLKEETGKKFIMERKSVDRNKF